MTPPEQEVYAYLDTLDIPFERYEHPPVVTVDEAERHWAGIDATHAKNLFLRNQRGDRHYLVIVTHSKRVDLRILAGQIGDGKLSFASSERMMTHLGVTPGAVSRSTKPAVVGSMTASSVTTRSTRRSEVSGSVQFFTNFASPFAV